MDKCYQCQFLIIEPQTLANPGGGPERCFKDVAPDKSGNCSIFQKRIPKPKSIVPVCDYIPTDDDIPF